MLKIMILEMELFKKAENPEEKKALEKLVKDTFCGKKSVVACPYSSRIWCEKNCGYYLKVIGEEKYWTR